MNALSKGPLNPEEIRDATGNALRNLGPEGKKKGLTTTLHIARGRLQSSGDIRRVPINGRLDQQRYRYMLWRPNPLAKFKVSADEVQTELARRYFSWIGPATLAEFQWFSAMSGKAAKAAISPLRLEPLDGERLMLPGDREKLEAFKIPRQAQYVLVSGIDGLSLLRRDLESLLDASDSSRRFLAGEADLPSHGIFDRLDSFYPEE